MACSKYTLTNTGTTAINFTYRRCDDAMWEYQVNLDPNQTKNIWLIDNTFGISPVFSHNLQLVNDGAYPLTPTPTPTPTSTPASSPTQTPTPSVTPTNTSTPTVTPTPTSSPIVSFAYTNLYSGINEVEACSHTPKNETYYGLTATTFSSLTMGAVIYQDAACTTPVTFSHISNGVTYIQTLNDGSIFNYGNC
jgi:hypothetical protein